MTDINQQSTVPEKKSKKKYFIIGGVILFIVLLIVANASKAKENKTLEDTEEPIDIVTDLDGLDIIDTQLSDSELQQQALETVYGEPPAGFRWNDEGEPVPVSDASLTSEEVIYQYIRALSLLDMANAAKFARVSTVIGTLSSYYELSESSEYHTQFSRKVYSEVLTSIEVEGVEREAVFANGRRIFTINISLLDLSNKDFWKDDSIDIFTVLRTYMTYEEDSIKAEQYIMDLILNYFGRDDAKKRTIQVDIVLDKVSKGGWLVVDDADLNTACTYKDGTSVYSSIMSEYSKWLEGVQNAEREQAELEAEEKAKAEEDKRQTEDSVQS